MTKKIFYQKWLFALLLIIGCMQIQAQGPCGPTYSANVSGFSPSCGNYGLKINPEPTVIYSNDFSSGPCGCTDAGLYQTINDTQYNGIQQNVLLVPDQTDKSGGLIFNPFTLNMPSDWEVKFKFVMLNKSGADGFSFNLGNFSVPGNYEDGVNQGLAIRFKTFNQDKVSVAWNGTELQTPTDMTLERGVLMDVKATVIAGRISLYVNGRRITNNLLIPGYAQNNNYKMIFLARTGGVSNAVTIDDVSFANPSGFTYSVDGTTYQASNVFNNITVPADRKVPIYIKQDNCGYKIRDFLYPTVGHNLESNFTYTNYPYCNPDKIYLAPSSGSGGLGYTDKMISFRTAYDVGTQYIHDGITVGGGAEIIPSQSRVVLTLNENDSKGYMTIEKPTSFSPTAFEFSINQFSNNLSGADGFSINFGDPTPIVNETVDYEDGVTSGLALRCKTNGQDNISLFYNGTQIGSTNTSVNLESGAYKNISVKVIDTTINVFVDGVLKISGTLPATYATNDFSNSKFVVAARTGGGSNTNIFSNVTIYDYQKLLVSKDNTTFSLISTLSLSTIPGNSYAWPYLPITQAEVSPTNHTTDLYYKFENSCSFPYVVPVLIKYTPPASPSPTSQVAYGNSITGASVTLAAPENTTIESIQYLISGGSSWTNLTPSTVLPVGNYTIQYLVKWLNTASDCPGYYTINFEVRPLIAPTGKSIQVFSGNGTIANLTANTTTDGSDITWYDAATDGNALTATSPIVDGDTYYAGQTVASQATPRLAVTVRKISNNPITICGGTSNTYAELINDNTTPTTGYVTEIFADSNDVTLPYADTDVVSSGTKYLRQRETVTSTTISTGAIADPAKGFYIRPDFGGFGASITTDYISYTTGTSIWDGALNNNPQRVQKYSNGGFDIKSQIQIIPGSFLTYFLATTDSPVTSSSNYLMKRGGFNNAISQYTTAGIVVHIGDINNGPIATNILDIKFDRNNVVYMLLPDKSLCKLNLPTPTLGNTDSPILNNVEFFRFEDHANNLLIGELNAIKVYKTSDYTNPILTINNTGKVIDIARTDNGNIFAIVENASNIVELVSYDKDGNERIVIESPTTTRNIEYFKDKVIWPVNNLLDVVKTMKRPLLSNKVATVVNLGGTSAPTADATTFCDSATVADLVATGANLQWYDVATGGTALPATTALTTGTYYVSQTVSGCQSTRTSVSVSVNTTSAPTASAQTFCGSTTIANLVATGTALQWYNGATGGTALSVTTALSTGTYYVSQTLSGCESTRTSVSVTVNTTSAPTASAQTFCGSTTVANLVATGTALQWYNGATGGAALSVTTALSTGTYYVSQTLSGCESTRTSVSVTVNTLPTAPEAFDQSHCDDTTINDLIVGGGGSGITFKWYTTATGSTEISTTTLLTTGTYYVSQTVNGCESTRTSVSVTINTASAPTASAQTFCGSATVANLAATGTTLQWYNAATGGIALASSTAIVTGTYYVSQTLSGCESTRTSVSVTIIPASNTTITNSDDVLSVAETGATYQWYTCESNGTFTSISNATNQNYTATAIGSYAVDVTKNDCTTRSECFNVTALTSNSALSNAALAQIGNEADSPNMIPSTVTIAQLGAVLPAITGIIAANEAAYQAYIDANPSLFSSPATAAEIQAMVNAVNTSLAVTVFDMDSVLIYPNPSNAIFNIKINANATIELLDAMGKTVKSDKISMGITSLDLSNYSDGIYLVRITNEINQTKTVRLIKR